MDSVIYGVFRGFMLGLSFDRPRSLPKGVLHADRSREGHVCYNLSECTRVLDSASQALLFADTISVSFLMDANCSFPDSVCVGRFESVMPACANLPRKMILPANVELVYHIFGVYIIIDYIYQLDSSGNSIEALQYFGTLVNYTQSKIDFDYSHRSITDCSSDFSSYVSHAKSIEELGILTSLSCMAVIWKRLACNLSESVNVTVIAELSDPYERNISATVIDYLLNSDGLTLPAVRRSNSENESKSDGQLNLWSTDNESFALDSVSGVVTISSIGLLSNISVPPWPPEPCSLTTALPVLSCEEIPSYLCDSYDGCWVAWGPCQSVSPGYYSPRGSVNAEFPCPHTLATNQIFTPSDPIHTCQLACMNSGELYSNGTCHSVSPGWISRSTCDGSNELIECPRLDGVIFTVAGSCSGRYLAVALGSFKALSPQGFTVETWVKINTFSMSAGGAGNIVPLYGLFGSAFLGIEYVDESAITLAAFVMTDTDFVLLSSSRLDHLKNTQWYHLSFTWQDERNVSFFKDGVPIDSISHTASLSQRSTPALVSSLLSPTSSSQLRPYLNREHFGPFRLATSDLHTGLPVPQNPWSAYLVTSFPDLELFRPNMIDRTIEDPYELGFYGVSPPGYREKVDPVIPDLAKSIFTCKNVCLGNPISCGPLCEDAIWNPIACSCEKRTTSCAPTEQASSTPDLASKSAFTTELPSQTLGLSSQKRYSTTVNCDTTTTSAMPSISTPADIGDAIACVLCVAFFVGVFLIYFIRKRRVNRILSEDQSSHVFALPQEQGWFTNVTIADTELFLPN